MDDEAVRPQIKAKPMTHGKDIPGLLMRAETAARIMSEYEAWEPPVPPPVDPVDYAWTAQVITDLVAALRPAADPKAEGLVEPIAWLRDLQPEAEDQALAVCIEGDPGGFPVYAALPTPDAERAGGPPVAWRWRYTYPTGPGGWHLRASMVEATPSTKWECEREVEPLYASPQSPATDPPRDGSWVLLRTNLRPSVEARWGALNEDGEGWISADGFWALEEGEDVTGYRQSPATEAVRVAPLEWRLFSNSRNASGYALGRQEYFILYAEVANRFRVYGIPGPHDGSAEYTTQDEAKAAAQADYEQRILSALIRPPINNSPGEHIVADVSKAAADLHERADELWMQLLPVMQVSEQVAGRHDVYADKVAALAFIEAALRAAPPADTGGATKP